MNYTHQVKAKCVFIICTAPSKDYLEWNFLTIENFQQVGYWRSLDVCKNAESHKKIFQQIMNILQIFFIQNTINQEKYILSPIIVASILRENAFTFYKMAFTLRFIFIFTLNFLYSLGIDINMIWYKQQRKTFVLFLFSLFPYFSFFKWILPSHH